jgi:transcriptional regulator of arginine metabolism
MQNSSACAASSACSASRRHQEDAKRVHTALRGVDSLCIFMQHARNFMQPPDQLRSEHDPAGAHARRSMLAKIIREQAVGRQTELVQLLRKRGHQATQSSVSRDLRELGVAKLGDRYVLPDTPAPARNVFEALRPFVNARLTAGTNLTVLKTTIGSAQSVAVAIDTARWPEVVGTISGDDTIFIATAGAGAQRKLGERLLSLFGR